MEKKIDIHLHLSERPIPDGLGMKISSGAEMLPHLDELGIGFGIIMSSGETQAMFGSNASCRRIAEQYPDRYAWMCGLDETEPETVYERLKQYREEGAVGVGELAVNHRLDHPFLEAVFQAAEALGLPVLFHMSPEEGFQYGVVDEPGLPLLERALNKYPKLIFIGHSQPFWHEISGDAGKSREERYEWGKGPVTPGGRLGQLFEKYPNLYGDLSANSGGCAMMRDEAFGLAFLEAWKDRLMFGTDMVNVDMEFPLGGWLDQKVEEGALSFAACQAIVSGNAKRIFGLGRKLAVNAEEKTDEKTEEKMVKGD
jgi:uncharacterized protein